MVLLETLPVTDVHIINYIRSHVTYGITLPLFVQLGWCICTAYFVIFAIKERMSSAKLLQMMYGVNTPIFWFPRFFCDLSILILLAILSTFLSRLPGYIGYNQPIQLCKFYMYYSVGYDHVMIDSPFFCSDLFPLFSFVLPFRFTFHVSSIFLFSFATLGLRGRHQPKRNFR